MSTKRHWLVKSEPDAFSIDDLRAAGTEPWDGIRNYQARNMMRDDMAIGDRVLFYHSNAKPPGLVGLAEVASEPYPDPTAFDPASKYYDPKSDPDDPRWILVDLRYVDHLPRFLSLDELKQRKELDGMPLLAKGQRLSVMPIEKQHYDAVVALASTSPTTT